MYKYPQTHCKRTNDPKIKRTNIKINGSAFKEV